MLIRVIITANLSLILTLSAHMKLMLGSNFSTHHTEIALEVVIDFQLMHQASFRKWGISTSTRDRWQNQGSSLASSHLCLELRPVVRAEIDERGKTNEMARRPW